MQSRTRAFIGHYVLGFIFIIVAATGLRGFQTKRSSTVSDIRSSFQANLADLNKIADICNSSPGIRWVGKNGDVETYNGANGDEVSSSSSYLYSILERHKFSSALCFRRLDIEHAPLNSVQIFVSARGLAVSGSAAGYLMFKKAIKGSEVSKGGQMLEKLSSEACGSDCWYVFYSVPEREK